MATSGERFAAAASAASVSQLRGLNAWQRHQHFLRVRNDAYGRRQGAAAGSAERTDADVVREKHRFLWDRDDGAARRRPTWGDGGGSDGLTWEEKLAKRYHDRLFKEYALADMSRYREGAIGLRWRTEREVLEGRGHFSCGNKACASTGPLTSYELLFRYDERGATREALVKLRCCDACAYKLHYRKNKERRREERREERRRARREGKARKRRRSEGGGEGDDESGSDSGGAAGGAAGGVASGMGGPAGSPADAPAPATRPGRGEGAAANVWLEAPDVQKTRRDQFDDYFDDVCGDLFL